MSNLLQAMQSAEVDGWEYMVQRYPRLTRAMKWVAILAHPEAGAALRDYVYARDGLLSSDLLTYGGGEAVCHFGGPVAVIKAAIHARKVVRNLNHRQIGA